MNQLASNQNQSQNNDDKHNVTLTNLDSATIPLTGRHLIEASAGTGKTYNITRIYLRLLLERELKVEEILLMTFTKDATQELRGRIDAFIREALNNWQTLCDTDEYFQAINARVSKDKIEFLLKRALLFLDEAAIFTIHGFCQRALSQHAFASGLPFNANMSTNSNELVLEATQDWYRQLAKQSVENFALVAQFWSTPSDFVSSFAKAISHRSKLTTVDVQSLVVPFIHLAKQASVAISNNAMVLNDGLLTHKKAEEQEIRAAELVKLTLWLTKITQCNDEFTLLSAIDQPMPDYLLNGSRHPKAFKTQLADVLASAKEVKVQIKDLAKNINKAKAYQLVRTAIYQIRKQVKHSKEQLNCLDFDDLINTLADCLQSTENTENDKSNTLAQTLLAQYPVALVDEFQDTDPQQFSILQGIYYQANASEQALYLIGDPKQAIYGFRGGDIFAYLSARSDCDYHWLMDTNWRSSPNMVNAYNQLFLFQSVENHSVFGYGIPYQAVLAGKKSARTITQPTNAQPTNAQPTNAQSTKEQLTKNSTALQFIHFMGDEEGEKVNQSARSLMAEWCANEIVDLLSESLNGSSTNTPIKPQDIAILVRDGREANDIKEALLSANLASVFLSDRANLFHSEQAKQLTQLLKGILAPEDERLYLSALTCGLLGLNAAALYELQHDESAYQTLKFNFFDYKEQWHRQGFITMAINLMHQHFDFAKGNMRDNKARSLTNILHLFEILQSASQKFLQPQELLYWFEQQCNKDNSSAINELEAEQRLESDGDLIRIVTQHGAKGLEYPVVFIPFATRHKDPLTFGNKSVSYLEYHDEQGKLCLSLDGDEHAKTAMKNEVYAESIRLLYVAITRAEHRCYILCTAFKEYASSPLGKTLQWQPEQNITQSIQQLVDKSPETISLKQISFNDISVGANTLQQNESKAPELHVSKFVGKIERDWWLSSFSALSRNLRHGGVSTPDRDSSDFFENMAENNAKNYNSEQKLLRFQLTKGAHSGNLLHDILEVSNFKNSDNVDNNLLESIKWPLVKYGELASGFTETDLISWFDEILATPLISTEHSADNFCLGDLAIQKTLRESEFYFPMESAKITDLEILLTDHRNTSKAAPVRLPSYKYLKGMMHGFIDLVFERGGKYYVCDYKSSHLGDHFSDYNQEALRLNIEQNYYDLQYLIYSLALHRYLKTNLADYDVEQHFGGVYYLYVRGMSNDICNDDVHRGSGVYYRKITPTELTQLDSLFRSKESGKELIEDLNGEQG